MEIKDCDRCKNGDTHYMLVSSDSYSEKGEEIFYTQILPSVKQNYGQVKCDLVRLEN